MEKNLKSKIIKLVEFYDEVIADLSIEEFKSDFCEGIVHGEKSVISRLKEILEMEE